MADRNFTGILSYVDQVALANGAETVLPAAIVAVGVALQADPANTATIRWGPPGQVSATKGFPLAPGASVSSIRVGDLSYISLYAGAAGQLVNVVAV